MKFEDAYKSDWPTKVTRPDGGEVLCFGFVRGEDGVAYADDSFFDPMPSRPCFHVVMGKPKYRGEVLTVGDHKFSQIEHGERAATAWAELVGDRDPETIYDATEWDLKEALVLESTWRRVQSTVPCP